MAKLTSEQHTALSAALQERISAAFEPLSMTKGEIATMVSQLDGHLDQLEQAVLDDADIKQEVKDWVSNRPGRARSLVQVIVQARADSLSTLGTS